MLCGSLGGTRQIGSGVCLGLVLFLPRALSSVFWFRFSLLFPILPRGEEMHGICAMEMDMPGDSDMGHTWVGRETGGICHARVTVPGLG